ncbi:glycosyltransferase family 2 protein [Streptococcus caprae]|uniref:Glycosyltransferase family 2 protein n=1 Tax=Streptococcus caprae TaxID=1640501 RepID=A0ABV8CWB2_9STRE
MNVTIVLSSYNGEKYIAQQIDSIRQQTYQDWTLLIRDDGSSDRTPQIITDYCQQDSRIQFINADNRQNLGVIKSFYHLVKHQESDYYFFADQDDIWLPEKIAVTLACAESESSDQPLLVYTDLKVVDEELQVLHESMIRTQSHHANTTLLQELTENTVTGGTMMINQSLANLWLVTDELLMHDWYLALIAAAMGKLIYIDQPTQLYRQHSNNVLGARTLSKRMKNWVRPHRLIAKYWWLITSSQKQARQLLKLELPAQKRQLIQAYIGLLDSPFSERLRVLKHYGFSKNRAFHTLVFMTLMVTKIGYKE